MGVVQRKRTFGRENGGRQHRKPGLSTSSRCASADEDGKGGKRAQKLLDAFTRLFASVDSEIVCLVFFPRRHTSNPKGTQKPPETVHDTCPVPVPSLPPPSRPSFSPGAAVHVLDYFWVGHPFAYKWAWGETTVTEIKAARVPVGRTPPKHFDLWDPVS